MSRLLGSLLAADDDPVGIVTVGGVDRRDGALEARVGLPIRAQTASALVPAKWSSTAPTVDATQATSSR